MTQVMLQARPASAAADASAANRRRSWPLHGEGAARDGAWKAPPQRQAVVQVQARLSQGHEGSMGRADELEGTRSMGHWSTL